MPVAPRTFDEVVKRTAHLADAFRAEGAFGHLGASGPA